MWYAVADSSQRRGRKVPSGSGRLPAPCTMVCRPGSSPMTILPRGAGNSADVIGPSGAGGRAWPVLPPTRQVLKVLFFYCCCGMIFHLLEVWKHFLGHCWPLPEVQGSCTTFPHLTPLFGVDCRPNTTGKHEAICTPFQGDGLPPTQCRHRLEKAKQVQLLFVDYHGGGQRGADPLVDDAQRCREQVWGCRRHTQTPTCWWGPALVAGEQCLVCAFWRWHCQPWQSGEMGSECARN